MRNAARVGGIRTFVSLAGAAAYVAAATAGPPGFATLAPEATAASLRSNTDPSGILPADRATEWVPGLMAVGGIPAARSTCTTIQAASYGNGTRDATAGIQAAIDGCREGQVVQLSAGTFLVNQDIVYLNKGVTLRGAGAGATVLRRTNGAREGTYIPDVSKPVILVGSERWPEVGASYDLASSAVKGAHSVRLRTAPPRGLAVGQIVLIDELSNASWQADPAGRGRIWASADFRVVYNRHDPPHKNDDAWPGATSWFSRADRPTSEIKEVQAYDEGTRMVTFTSPFHIDYRTANAAQLTVYGSPNSHVKYAGVEDLKVQGGDDGNIRFVNAAYSWAKAVEVYGWLNDGIAVVDCFRVEIRGCYIHHPVWMEPGGGGYNLSLANGSSEILIEDNISVDGNKVMVARCAGAGSVVGYNYMDDGHIPSSPGWMEIGLNASHQQGPHHVLFEGNHGFNADSDKTHGNSIYLTFFRNHLAGTRRSFADNYPGRCAGAALYSYWMSFVGNVLGRPGRMSGWVYEAGSMAGGPAVWLLGWDDWAPYPTDPQVVARTHRHGNFDYLTKTVRWASGYSRKLPNSLYLAGKPAFFNAGRGYAWPWVDPTATPAVKTLPAKARYDAGTPFAQP